MSDPWHPEGIYQCSGCGRTYPEYVNGCVNTHSHLSSKVVLIVPEPVGGEPT